MKEQDLLRVRVNAMGLELGPFHLHLYKSLLALYDQWAELSTLFGPNPQNLEVLQGTAPWTFRVFRNALWREVLLGICRFADQAGTRIGGKVNRNLSINGMAVLLEPSLKAEVEPHIGRFMESVAPIKRMRDKALSHADYDTVLEGRPIGIDSIEMQSVDSALSQLAYIMNLVETHYLNGGTVMYNLRRFGGGGADTLLFYLQEGRKAVVLRADKSSLLKEDAQPRQGVR